MRRSRLGDVVGGVTVGDCALWPGFQSALCPLTRIDMCLERWPRAMLAGLCRTRLRLMDPSIRPWTLRSPSAGLCRTRLRARERRRQAGRLCVGGRPHVPCGAVRVGGVQGPVQGSARGTGRHGSGLYGGVGGIQGPVQGCRCRGCRGV
jgi:hypothetical protein